MITYKQIEEILQAVRGLPAGSPELDAALAAAEKNDRMAAAFMMEDVTEYAQKLAKKRTRLGDDIRRSIGKAKLKAHLAKYPLHDFDLNDEGALNNLLQLIYEPEYFDRFLQKEETKTPKLRQVYAEREIGE